MKSPFRFAAKAALGLALSMPAWAQGAWHEDADAGIRVRIPWADAQVKNGRQVEGLISERAENGLPKDEKTRYTSAVYAQGGLPFFVVWVRPDAGPPTQRDLENLADEHAAFGLDAIELDLATLRGTGTVPSDGGPYKSQVLFQVARGATVFLGYYYKDETDAAKFRELAASFELAPPRRVAFADLPEGAWGWKKIAMAVAAAAAGGLALLLVIAVRRRPVDLGGAREAEAPGDAAAAREPSEALEPAEV